MAKEAKKDEVATIGSAGMVALNGKDEPLQSVLAKVQKMKTGEELTIEFWKPEVGEVRRVIACGWRTVNGLNEQKPDELVDAVKVIFVDGEEKGESSICAQVVAISTFGVTNVARITGLTVDQLKAGAKWAIPCDISNEGEVNNKGKKYQKLRIHLLED